MGIGPANLGWFHHLAILGEFNGLHRVLEFGSQNLHSAGHGNLVADLFKALKQPIPPQSNLDRLADNGPARDLYLMLGMEYDCIDTDGRYGAIQMDLNFDTVPPDSIEKYDLTTNIGTAEHILNQLNVFRSVHEFTRPGGLMLHVGPFLGCIDHGFFSYQPNLYRAIARANGYDLLGIWINPNTSLPILIPWYNDILQYFPIQPTKDCALFVAFRKKVSAEFCVPFQEVYEEMTPDNVLGRYTYIVDGRAIDGLQALGRLPVARVEQPVEDKSGLVDALNSKVLELERDIKLIQMSKSWRLTAPLRALRRLWVRQ